MVVTIVQVVGQLSIQFLHYKTSGFLPPEQVSPQSTLTPNMWQWATCCYWGWTLWQTCSLNPLSIWRWSTNSHYSCYPSDGGWFNKAFWENAWSSVLMTVHRPWDKGGKPTEWWTGVWSYVRKQGRLVQMWGRYQHIYNALDTLQYSPSPTPSSISAIYSVHIVVLFFSYPCFLPRFFHFPFWKFMLKTGFIKWLPVMWIWITMFAWISNMSTTYQLCIFAYLLFWWLENADIYIFVRDWAGLSDIYVCNLQLS